MRTSWTVSKSSLRSRFVISHTSSWVSEFSSRSGRRRSSRACVAASARAAAISVVDGRWAASSPNRLFSHFACPTSSISSLSSPGRQIPSVTRCFSASSASERSMDSSDVPANCSGSASRLSRRTYPPPGVRTSRSAVSMPVVVSSFSMSSGRSYACRSSTAAGSVVSGAAVRVADSSKSLATPTICSPVGSTNYELALPGVQVARSPAASGSKRASAG